ncbi:MAG: hypothetical protein WKF79_09845 [Nocardioides sp.]
MIMPDNAPFVVQNSRPRFVVQSVVAGLFVVAGVVLLAMSFYFAGLLLLVGGGPLLALSLVSLRNTRSPLLAADDGGVILQAFTGPDGIRALAWSNIERVYVHRVGRQFRLLCVLPRDIPAEVAAWSPAQQKTIQTSLGTCGAPYSVNLVAAGVTDQQAGQALHQLAAGRTQIDLPT